MKIPTSGDDRLIKNWNVKAKRYVQNTGAEHRKKTGIEIAKSLQLEDADTYTSTCFRRPAATVLADAGASMLDLKSFGR